MQVDNVVGKLLLLLVVLGIGVFFGVGISRDGMEQTQGLDASEQQKKAEVTVDNIKDEMAVTAAADEAAASIVTRELPTSETFIMRLLGKLGSLLQLLAEGLIRLLVGLGEAVLS